MKLLNNNSKHFEAISNNGVYHIKARMKVDYDSVNDFWGAREWVYVVTDKRNNKQVNLVRNGINVLKKSYLKKCNFLKDLEEIGIFNQALNELKK